MPLYDYICHNCSGEFEVPHTIATRNDPTHCPVCDAEMERVIRPQRQYKPFQPYFDEGLGEFITGRDHRRRVMKTLGMDFKDHMSAGDISARKDWANEARRERLR